MKSLEARLVCVALLFGSAWGCGSGATTSDPQTGAGGEASSPIDQGDVVSARMARPAAAGSPDAEGVGVFQALSSRAIRTVHVVPGSHLALVANYDDTLSLIDLESGGVRAMRRLAFEGEVEARFVVDESGAFGAIAVMPLPEAGGGSGPVYLWDLAADRTRIARRGGNDGFVSTQLAIVPGGSEIALFERASDFAAGQGGERLVRIDPFRRSEQVTAIAQESVVEELAYSGPTRRAVVTSHRVDMSETSAWATHILGADGTDTKLEDAVGPTFVRPTGGQMLVQTASAWQLRNPSDGSVVATLAIPQASTVAYSSTGACIVARVDDAKFVFIDPNTGNPVAELGAQEVLGMDAIGRCERALTLGHDRSILLVDLAEGGAEPRRFDAASFAWTAASLERGGVGLASTDDGRFAVTWDGDSIVTYDITRGTSQGVNTLGYAPSVWSVTWSARGDALLAQTREASFLIDGSETSATNMSCGLGYVVQTPPNGAFVVEEGRSPRCAFRMNAAASDEEQAVRYSNAGDAVVTLGRDDVGLVRVGAPRKRIAMFGDLRCTVGAPCQVHAAFSRDDSLVALMGTGVVVIADIARGRIVARHPVNAGAYALAFTSTSSEVLAISDSGFERLPVRGRTVTRVTLPSPSRVPESAETDSYIRVEVDKLVIVRLEGGQLVELEGDWQSVELVSPDDPFLFRAEGDEGALLVDVANQTTRPVHGALLGARRIGNGLVVASCVEGDIKVEGSAADSADSTSLGDCTGVRQVAISPDGRRVVIVRGAVMELRRLDGSVPAAFVELLETSEEGYVMANSAGRFYAPIAALPFIRFRAPGDARTAALAPGVERTGYDAHLLDAFFAGGAPAARAPAAPAPEATP